MEMESQRTDELEHLGKLIKDLRTGMLTTLESDGSLRSRPLVTLRMDSEPALWFLTSISSPKVAELDHHAKVGLTYSNGDSDFVSVSGDTWILRDRDLIQGLWTPLAKIWFPEGADDPDLAALKVLIRHAEYWDGPDSKLVQLFSIAQAAISGEESDLRTESEKLEVSQRR